MSDEILQQIQALQFSDLDAANQKLKTFVAENTPLAIAEARIRPSAVSLNSINGTLKTESGETLFFKTHVEPQSIVSEYYNAGILAEVGYPTIRPIYSSTEWGKQLLIYPFFEYSSMFDALWELETHRRNDSDRLVAIQQQADEQLWEIYARTLDPLSAEEHARAPVHQLFHYRLIGGRLANFYLETEIALPGEGISFNRLAEMKWVINGVEFESTLGELIEKAIALLDPRRGEVASVVGHGDAHNGNVFLDEAAGGVIYFDPAFAGRHSPWLDLAKPVFHNCFATWMYFPKDIARQLSIRWQCRGGAIVVEHDFQPHPVRIEMLRSKLQTVARPLLETLRPGDRWREYFQLALFCCPLLTMNLANVERFPPEIALLGFCYAVEMGSRASAGNPTNWLDAELNRLME